jgi:type II secretory pathway component PulK
MLLLASLTAALGAVIQTGAAASRNRIAMMRAQWRVEGCVARIRWMLDDELANPLHSVSTWDHLGEALHSSSILAESHCAITALPTGISLNINTASREELSHFLQAFGVVGVRVDSLVAAVLDWRDVDDVARSYGAERTWYAAKGLDLPRNAPFESTLELCHVRGFDELINARPELLSQVTVDSGRMLLDAAPQPVIASIPGIGAEALQRIATLRARGSLDPDILVISSWLSAPARDSILHYFGDPSSRANRFAREPDGWIVAAEATEGDPAVTVRSELRIERGSARAVIKWQRLYQ